jgi:hypothetical protein
VLTRRERRLHDSGFTLFDTVLDKISETVGNQPVESGGALLGDFASGIISDFLFDNDAETTATSYVPSRKLAARVTSIENVNRLQFKGVLHSHPGNYDVPSGPDRNSFAVGLRANPSLVRYLAPIVTFYPGPPSPNKIALPGGGWISFYVAFREEDGSVRIEPTMPDIVHFGRDCRAISSLLELKEPKFFNSHNGSTPVLTAQFELTNNLELLFTADGSYPNNPPQGLIFNKALNTTRQLDLRWHAQVDSSLRLLHSLSENDLHSSDFPTSLAFGRRGEPLTQDELNAQTLDLDPIFVGENYDQKIAQIESGIFARSKGLLSDELGKSNVLVNGAGSVGSYVAEQLVRSGVGSITLIDPDIVEYANLSRTNYVASDVGQLKVNALSRRLLSISPSLQIQILPENLHNLESNVLENLFSSADLVICAVDDRRAQLMINHWAYHHEKPAVFIGVFAGAKSGEVCWIEPPNPCYNCATQFRAEIAPDAIGQTDYGTGQLVAEVALGVDIQAICTIGIRIGLSALVRKPNAPLADYVNELGKKQYVVLAVDPKESHISQYFDPNTAGQYGHKSLWMQTIRNDECNVCGDNRDSPVSTVQISTFDIQAAILAAQADSPTNQKVDNELDHAEQAPVHASDEDS